MRGLPLYNWPAFEDAADDLCTAGHDVVSPTEIDEDLGVATVERDDNDEVTSVLLTDRYDFDEVIGRDLEEVVKCDAICLLPGWSKSVGALKEFEAAKAAGLKIFNGVEAVPYNDDGDLYPILDEVDELRHQQRNGEETRIVDAETGGAKGSKPCQLFSAPPAGLEALGRVCGMGADKYELHNFRNGYAWSLSANAMLRHYLAWNAGEDADPESGVSHLAHVAWHALVLIQFAQDHPGKDDRYRAAA